MGIIIIANDMKIILKKKINRRIYDRRTKRIDVIKERIEKLENELKELQN